MSVKLKLALVLGFLVSANLTVWGAKTLLATQVVDPILRALGS